MGRLERIWIKRMKGGPMDEADRVATVAGRGLAGNANQGGTRQVTIITAERWRAVTAGLGARPDPAVRRANLMVSGVDFTDARLKVLRVGGCRIRILGETRPCEQMDQAADGLKRAMSQPWGGGAFGEVLDDAEIAVGDPVSWDAQA
ncbi:MAG: MOSC domain-containing protein [Acidobacteriota bacterium]